MNLLVKGDINSILPVKIFCDKGFSRS